MMTRASLTDALADVEGWLGDDEAWTLHRAVAARPATEPVTVVEIGSWKGRSTIALATAVADRPAGGVVLAVDPHEGGVAHRLTGEVDTFDQLLANLERAGVAGVVDPVRTTSRAARGVVADHSVEVLFVDGSHRFEDVLGDIDAWESALVPGALAAFHDSISYPGVRRALRARALIRGSSYRRPRLVEETMTFDYRPGQAWRSTDSLRMSAMRARVLCLRSARRVRYWVRRLGGWTEVPR
jgi:predicted O-methyltransferase YrrM